MTKIIATDFDGVICNGLAEYFYSSKLAYEKIWLDSSREDLNQLQGQFNLLRPVVETGWEMPVLLRALIMGKTESAILSNWQTIAQDILQQEQLNSLTIGQTLDQVRHLQIQENLSAWLALHHFYPGVISQLNNFLSEQIKLYIITTKEGIFVRQLLREQGINLAEEVIMGKEQKRPKYESLRLILAQEKVRPEQVCFIEDRLEALELVQQQPDLQGMKLFLADWGYNTEQTRASLSSITGIKLLSLSKFTSNHLFCL
jgi:phosphoglycolate phosphatase-like HAD superfamily hydrolase